MLPSIQTMIKNYENHSKTDVILELYRNKVFKMFNKEVYLLWFWEDYQAQYVSSDLYAVCASIEKAKEFVKKDVEESNIVWVQHNGTECARTSMSAWTIQPVTLDSFIIDGPAFPGEDVFNTK